MRPLRVVLLAALVLALSAGACTSAPAPGEIGKLRFAGRVLGAPPLRLLPPIADPTGNVYTLFGALDLKEVAVFASRAGGGQVSACNLTKGDRYGAHGWVGFAQERVWYWSGDALVSLFGGGEACSRVLDRDPGTNVNLAFRAVLPWVRDAPSRVSLVALVQSPVDPAPFSVMVDLNLNLMSNVRGFDPPDATKVQTIGVGAVREENVGFLLLQYDRKGATIVEGRRYDASANITARAVVRGGPFPEYGVRGYLQRSADGLVVGLLADGRLVAFDESSGRVLDPPPGLKPVGVHVWDGKLWLVGLSNDRPAIAAIESDGQVGEILSWTASEEAAQTLQGPQEVIDDRALPSRRVTWPEVGTGIGEFPFLSPFSPTRHADGTTLWVVAGPKYDVGGILETSFAMAPFGIRYP